MKLAASLGVSSLKFGELEVQFDRNFIPEKRSRSKTVRPVDDKIFDALTNEAEMRDRLEKLEEDMETGHLTDPHEFEKLLIQKELVNAEEKS